MHKQRRYEKVILLLELVGFGAVLLLLWLDEYLDLPFRYLGALQTPARPQEFWFEALAVLLLGILVIAATLWVFRRLRFLEDFIRVCAWCRKVEVGDQWLTFEDYMKLQHDVKATHSICPACRAGASKPRAAEMAAASF
jgi:hypothetical protein